MKTQNHPGVMLYFDRIEPLMDLDNDTLADLFRAIVQYSRYGVAPVFSGSASILWRMLQPSLDADAARYENVRAKRQYANYCGRCKDKGIKPLTFTEWQTSDAHTHANVDTCTHMPHMRPTPNPTPDPTSISPLQEGSGRLGGVGGKEPSAPPAPVSSEPRRGVKGFPPPSYAPARTEQEFEILRAKQRAMLMEHDPP